MANGFLVPFATGALTELQRQKQASDEIAASVVDNVSQHVLGVEIPAERKLIKEQENLKNQYATTYGQKVADGMDAMGLFETGNEQGLFNAVRMRFGDKYSIDTIADKINKASDEDYGKLIQTSFIGTRKSALEDRGAYIDSVLKDTKNIKDLLVGETPKGLARFIGEPLGKKDEATATARLTQALEGPSRQPAQPADAASLLGLDATTGKGYMSLEPNLKASVFNSAKNSYSSLEKNAISKRFKKNFTKNYDPKIHGPSEDMYGLMNYFQNYYLPQIQGMTYDGPNKIGPTLSQDDVTKFNEDSGRGTPKKVSADLKPIKGEEFEYLGEIYKVPDRFKGQDLPVSVKKSIASQQKNFGFEGLNANNPSVILAQDAINRARAAGNVDAVEAIKDQLRKDLRVSNLEGLIK